VSSRRGTFIVLSLILVAILLSVGGSLLLLAGGAPPPSIPSASTLYMRVRAPFDEVEPLNLFTQYSQTATPTLRGTIEMIHRAKNDSRVKTLVITPSGNALWAQLQEVRAALIDFRKSGKPITAYLEYGGPQEYYVASVADRVMMMPAGTLDLSGLATYELFFRGALDKIGVFPDLLHIGDYKTYSNTFVEKGFTAAHREMSKSLNHDWYDQLVKAIADGRKKSEADIVRAIDGGPYMADDAMRAGLIDAIGYEDQIDDEPPVKGTRPLEDKTYREAAAPTFGDGPRIALLYATGTITSGTSSFDGPSGQVLGSDTFAGWLRKVRVDPAIRAIIVRIDSPGGSAIASDVIWRELMLTKGLKPLIVSMGDVAASGGYYIAVAADRIIAEPGTITGSIGVVTGKFVVKGTLDKLGIGEDSVSDGRFAEIDSPFSPFTKDERARVEEQLRATYDLFLTRVADGRKTTTENIDRIARGRVWTGRQALDLNLVDELGGLDTAIQVAKQRARIDPSRNVQLVVYPPKRSIYDLIANPFGATVESTFGLLAHRPESRVVGALNSMLGLFRRGEPLTIMPNVFWN
jgi:protease-4